MTQRIATILITVSLCATAFGQDARRVYPESGDSAIKQEPYVIHVTDLLTMSPEGQEALRKYHERKAAGLLPVRDPQPAKAGELRTFRVLNFTTRELDEIEFESKGDSINDPAQSGFRLWVEVAELNNGNVTDGDIAALIEHLAAKTPPNSFNPDTGVVANVETIFGEPPDVDGDGILDVLLVNVRDDYDGETEFGFVAGFVTPADLDGSVGNGADILYLDTWPMLTSANFGVDAAAQTAAHEYQHFIMYRYDRQELSFINEAISEWSEVALGYPGRRITYLAAPRDYNVPLYRWNREDPFDDYQRAGLFMTYYGNRFGVLESGYVTRQAESGTAGLTSALGEIGAGITVPELVYDFHLANYINDTSLGAEFGYTSPDRLDIKATPRRVFEGSASTSTPTETVSIVAGGVAYVEWRKVNDFKVAVEREALAQQEVRASLIRYGDTGQYVETLDVPVNGDTLRVEGESGRAVLVIAGINPDSSPASVDYGAAWSPSEAATELVLVQYDDGYAVGRQGTGREGAFFSMAARDSAVIATRFTPHADTSDDRLIHLDRVWVAPYWFSQFTSTGIPADARRDFVLYVWSAKENAPDSVLFQKEFVDPSTAAPFFTLAHVELDLSAESQAIGALPDTVFIGIGELGTDPNYMIVGPSAYDGDDISYIGNSVTGRWRPLWDVRFESGDTTATDNTVVPTRAQFILTERPPPPTSVTPLAALPRAVTLEQNYPNPFNPATTISFELPETAHVRLQVFDAMGRRIATLVDRLQPAGRQRVDFHARSLASGIYFYRLETGTASLTKRMMLIK